MEESQKNHLYWQAQDFVGKTWHSYYNTHYHLKNLSKTLQIPVPPKSSFLVASKGNAYQKPPVVGPRLWDVNVGN